MKSEVMHAPPDTTEKIGEYVTNISNTMLLALMQDPQINTVCMWRHVQSQTP